MQVFFDEQAFQYQRFGGVTRYFVELARALAATGQIQVCLFGGWTANAYLPGLRTDSALQVKYLPRPASWRVNRLAASLSRQWRRRAFSHFTQRNPQTIYHPTYFADDTPLRAQARATVVTFFDLIPELFPDDSGHSRRNREERAAIAGRAHRLLAISDSTGQDLAKIYPPTNGRIDVTPLAASPPAAPTGQPPSIRPYFLLVGHRHHYKNGTLALRAFARLADRLPEPILILGGGPPLDAAERALLAKPLAQNRVEHRPMSDEALDAAYRGALGFLYPSRYEGFGLPILEAMQRGCPVITTRSSSLPEVAGEAALYTDPDDEEALLAHLLDLATHPASRARLAELGRAQAARFSWQRTATLTLAAYRRALESGPANGPAAI